MDSFKTFYNEKKGKQILFLSFYLIFFIFLAIYVRSYRANNPTEKSKEEQVEEKITTYDISNLVNNDYTYHITIVSNEDVMNFNGTKSNIDYANYENKYFLDIYNINQLLKRSRLVNSENNVLTYELDNKEINDILLTNKEDGVNKIDIHVNDKTEVSEIDLDLSKYLEKELFQVSIVYEVGEENENSTS